MNLWQKTWRCGQRWWQRSTHEVYKTQGEKKNIVNYTKLHKLYRRRRTYTRQINAKSSEIKISLINVHWNKQELWRCVGTTRERYFIIKPSSWSKRSDSQCGRSDTSDSDSSPDEPSSSCRVDGVYSSGGRVCWVWRTDLQRPFTNVQGYPTGDG